MVSSDDTVRALREAVEHSPDNVPLRQHLADTLMGRGHAEEAEKQYRFALTVAPDNPRLRLGLATAFHDQGKFSQALVLVEDLIQRPNPPARAQLLYARLLLQAGDVARAAQRYRAAVEAEPALADSDLAGRLAVGADPEVETVVEGKVRRPRQDAGGGESTPPVERSAVTFADVGGMDALKDEIRLKIIHPLTHPTLYAAYGKAVGGGILLYGPPGCGKTHLARATAGEVKAAFISVGINDVLDMWVGQSERNLHGVFEAARNNRPCVLFFDEVDALGAARGDMRAGGQRQMINQFLAELDGVDASNEGVLILAATNAPWHLDPAFRRPGRFDRVLFVPPPDAGARAAILRILLRGKPQDGVDYEHLARKTDASSGADLKGVVDLAVEKKLQEALKGGLPLPLTTRDLASAAGCVRPSTKEWFATARNYALYANQGGAYDDILKYLKL
jgi:ATP-dependent 26S proteasome regulatory subunit